MKDVKSWKCYFVQQCLHFDSWYKENSTCKNFGLTLNLFYNSRIEFILLNVKYVHKNDSICKAVLLPASQPQYHSILILQVVMDLFMLHLLFIIMS